MKKTLSFVILTLLALTLTSCAAFADTPLINRIQYMGNGRVVICFDRDINVDEHSILVRDYAGSVVPAAVISTQRRRVVLRVPNAVNNRMYRFEIDGVNAGSGSGGLFYSNSFFTKDNWYEDWTNLARDYLQHPGRPGTRNNSGYNGPGKGDGHENRSGRPYWYENKPGQQQYQRNGDRPERPRSGDFRPERPRSGDFRPERPRSGDVRPERPRSHDFKPGEPPKNPENKPGQPPRPEEHSDQQKPPRHKSDK